MRFRSSLLLRLLAGLLAGALLPALAEETVRFAVIGDSGTGEAPQHAVARRMEQVHEDRGFGFVLMLGDNIYEDGGPEHFDSKFKDVYKKLMDRGVRFHASLGNHDRQTNNGRDQVNDEAFGYVGKQDEYQFKEGKGTKGGSLARFIALNSEARLDALKGKNAAPRSDRLKAWLDESNRYNWNILYMHHPPYAYVRRFLFVRLGHGSAVRLRRALEPLIKGKVDVVFAGHDHFYQKIRPQESVHYFVSGAAAKLRPGVKKKHRNVEFAVKRHHFMYVELTASEFRYEAIDPSGEVLHSGVIRKQQSR